MHYESNSNSEWFWHFKIDNFSKNKRFFGSGQVMWSARLVPSPFFVRAWWGEHLFFLLDLSSPLIAFKQKKCVAFIHQYAQKLTVSKYLQNFVYLGRNHCNFNEGNLTWSKIWQNVNNCKLQCSLQTSGFRHRNHLDCFWGLYRNLHRLDFNIS